MVGGKIKCLVCDPLLAGFFETTCHPLPRHSSTNRPTSCHQLKSNDNLHFCSLIFIILCIFCAKHTWVTGKEPAPKAPTKNVVLRLLRKLRTWGFLNSLRPISVVRSFGLLGVFLNNYIRSSVFFETRIPKALLVCRGICHCCVFILSVRGRIFKK